MAALTILVRKNPVSFVVENLLWILTPQEPKFSIQSLPMKRYHCSVVFIFHLEWYAFVLTWSTFYTTGIKVNEIKLGPQLLELI